MPGDGTVAGRVPFQDWMLGWLHVNGAGTRTRICDEMRLLKTHEILVRFVSRKISTGIKNS